MNGSHMTMYTVKVRPVPESNDPGIVQGTCTCGEKGPATPSATNASLWCVGHHDGHRAASRV